jgi:hypothetical protein
VWTWVAAASAGLQQLLAATGPGQGAGLVGFDPSIKTYTISSVGSFLNDLAKASLNKGAALIGYLAPFTGAVATTQSVYNNSQDINAVSEFGLSTANSETSNKAILDSAIAAAISSGRSLYIPSGVYQSTALAPITAGVTIYGDPGRSYIDFNTTSDAILCAPTNESTQQNDLITFRGLSFKTHTNTAASIIANGIVSSKCALNVLIDRCLFYTCSATYAIDNRLGYGMTVRESVIVYHTGSGMRMKSAAADAYYSYSMKLTGCDFGSISGDAVEVEGGFGPFVFSGCVFENCGGWGINCNTISGNFTTNLVLDGCYFEGNTAGNINLASTGTGILSRATLTGCMLGGKSAGLAPLIALGTYGQIIITGCSIPGSYLPCNITGNGSASAKVFNSYPFVKTGTFAYYNDDGSDAPLASVRGSIYIPGSTPTTMFSLTSVGLYLVSAIMAGNSNAGNYCAAATVLWDGGSGRIINASNGSSVTITLSGANVMVSQASSYSQTITWSMIKMA